MMQLCIRRRVSLIDMPTASSEALTAPLPGAYQRRIRATTRPDSASCPP